MPYTIRKQGEKYCVYGPSGNHGCHDSREKARRQQRALYRAERLNTSVVGDTVMETAKESMETMAEHSYEIRMKDGKHCVHESGTSTPVEGACYDTHEEAERHMRKMMDENMTDQFWYYIGPISSSVSTAPQIFMTSSNLETFNPSVTVTVTSEDTSSDEDVETRTPWKGVLAVEGHPTADKRYLMPGKIDDRELPLPLMVQIVSEEGHKGSEVGGRIEKINRIPSSEFNEDGFDLGDLPDDAVVIWAKGSFDGSETGENGVRLLENGGGVSLDLSVTNVSLLDPDTLEPVDPEELDLMTLLLGGGGYLTGIEGSIMGATVVPFAAFPEASIITASGVMHWIGFIHVEQEVLTASAAGKAPLKPPKAWFEMPEPNLPCPLTITEDGRVFGHLAVWGQCHTGFEGICQQPPRSYSDYKFFHLGEIETAEDECLAVGKITVGTPHAPLTYGSVKTQEHYDNTGCVAAFVRAHDGRRGIWLSGAIRSDVPAEKIRDLRANPPSGDWRRENGALELQGVLAVPIPGYPVPRTEMRLVASGGKEEVEALVATANVDELANYRKRKRRKVMLTQRLRQALGERYGNTS